VTTLVVGDVHGCAAELGRLLDEVRPDRVVLVGDLYTKGPDPAGVYKLIKKHKAKAVLGNHDARLLDALAGKRRKDAHAHEVIATLDAKGRSWRKHLRKLPLFLPDVAGFLVVHAGIHPTRGVSKTSRAMAISMRRYPRSDKSAPHWHRQYEGSAPVIFGHDAKGGLVRVERHGRPHIIGLDTGCVYGGLLSGYIPEEDALVQVPADRVYQAIR